MRRTLMQRGIMRRTFLQIVAVALLTSVAASAQSLGDVARENREKQNARDASSTTKPKVITNTDFAQDPDNNQAPNAARPAASAKW